MKKCWYEAFYSDSTVVNYLRLFTDEEAVKEYKASLDSRIEKLHIADRDYRRQIPPEMVRNNVCESEYRHLYFFAGHFDKVKDWCMKQKEPLGWSGKFIGDGVDLMLLYLYAEDYLQKGIKAIVGKK